MMEGPRSGRSLIFLALFCCLGPYLTPAVQSKKQSTCDRTYASDVKCGMIVLHPSSLPKHSAEAVRGEFPWHVAISQLEQRVPVYSCGGSLVRDRFVITAAHCVINANNGYPRSKDSFLVQLGHHELGVAEEGCSQTVGVQTVYVHPEYRSGVQRHDLAILELERPVRFNDRVLPICLDNDDEDQSGAFYRNVGKVPGWGYTEFDDVSSWLRMTEVPIVNYTRCLSNNPDGFYHSIHDGMFCGGYANGTNVCNGDSGGGLVTYRNGHWELQGIVSFTALREDMDKVLCDTQQYAGFVKVRYYKAWIGSIISGDWEWIGNDENEREHTSPKTAEALKVVPDCGKRQITTVPLIVNGVRSLAGQWPWHAAIFGVSKRSREYLCGGTLVSPSYILTSASCVTDWHPRKRPFVVQLGQNQLFESSITGREVRVLEVETSDDSSMALLRLEADVQYDDYIQPICLPTPNDTDSSAETGTNEGKDGLIVGYGQTDPTGDLSPFLQATLMPIVDSGLCMVYRIFDKKEAHKMFCAGHGNGTNACKGDEGGGFYEENRHGAWTITGVIGKINLYRKQCDPYGYVGLADVVHYLEWIMDRIRSALSLPSRVPPDTSHSKRPPKGCRRKHHRHHHHREQEHQHRQQHRRTNGSGSKESGSNEDSNEHTDPSITSAVKNVMQAKVDLVKDIHTDPLSVMKMEVPRSGRTLKILCLALVCVGPYFTPLVRSENQSDCDRTYPSDVQCGLPLVGPLNATFLPKHSAEAVRGEFPWHVAIFQKEYSSPVYACGGSLVSDRFVITAAHCVVNSNTGYPLSKDRFFLELGYHELGVPKEGCTQDLRVKNVHMHPQFRSGFQRHDLAILELERPVRFNDRVLPICLDDDDEDQTGAFYRNVGKVPGWGYTEFDSVSSSLRMTEVPITNYTRCLNNNQGGFAHIIYDGMFCGGYANGTNVCNGDSGGGLVTYRNKRWELQGIVSFTVLREVKGKFLCDTQHYAGFVKVRYYKAWISTILTAEIEPMTNKETEEGTIPKTTTSSKLPTDCGKRRITTVSAIVNGVRSLAGQWPWHVAIFGVSERFRKYLCGGTLVSANNILTAVSCVTDWHPQNRPFIVQLGQAQLFQSSITGREVRVLNVEKSDDSTMALLKLEVDVQYDDYIQPICLPATAHVDGSDLVGTRIGTDGVIAGYGETEPEGSEPDYLQSTTMPIVDSKICVMHGIFDEGSVGKKFCVGHRNGSGACTGDEGGGFYVVNEQGVWTIRGVIGNIKLDGKRCDPTGYIGLADVPFYNEWLTNRVEGPEDKGRYNKE
ncbi:uncharacterized protein LOC131285364 [Anopheles ziemanni]|uniref:uncharacterized protein LOC131265965 n=1 Tax=Anopheles coustani TaxID=139045 RepID=UPI00265A6C12|nr:uncharacterized protein LOC131265965 [Anopheles coustani]XP_058170199.1 uncharacterized protein LOC131285364 [Anopheles ziemanni]